MTYLKIYAMSKFSTGKIVELKDGRTGRTFDYKGLVNGKVPVYLTKSTRVYKTDKISWVIPEDFQEQAILCDPSKIKVTGLID